MEERQLSELQLGEYSTSKSLSFYKRGMECSVNNDGDYIS